MGASIKNSIPFEEKTKGIRGILMSKKIIRSRFEEDLDKKVEEFLSGKDILYDTLLIPYDILGNIAHHLMLNKIGAISDEDVKPILSALKTIYEKWKNGKFILTRELEDVHMNIEHAVAELVGKDVGGRMHLARSRNDQVLTDLRLFMRDEIIQIEKDLINLISVLIEKAEENLITLYIGYTHTQHAQPITFSHWCMAQVDTLIRDLDKLIITYSKVNTNPLGAVAIAGTSWPIDRQYTTELLGFEGIQENTLDVVSSRGEYIGDLVFNCATIMVHLGRMAEDIILATTSEFGYITLSDSYSTGSSIMPQKKNPDVLELIRARSGVMSANVQKILGILKGIPSGYNRDHQELKEPLFSSIEHVKLSLKVMAGLLSTMKINDERIKQQIQTNFITATELVDLIIQEYKIPFRIAYTIVGNLVKDLIKQGHKNLDDITPEILLKYVKANSKQDKLIALEKIKKALDPLETIKRRTHIGGPAPQEEQRMIVDRIEKLVRIKENILINEEKINQVFSQLIELITKKIVQ